MSTVTIAGVSPDPTIYGTLVDAIAYIGAMYGDTYGAWRELDDDDQARTLVAATRFLDQQSWIDDVDTFAARDALLVFQQASYELAVLVADDASVLTETDAGSNLKSAGAGGASIELFNPTSSTSGSASLLPPVLQRLIGDYLAADAFTAGTPQGSGSGCVSPFSDGVDYDRNEPY